MSLSMAGRIRKIYPYRLNKHCSKFSKGYPNQQTYEEGQQTQQLKHVNNNDKGISPTVHNIITGNCSSQKFRQKLIFLFSNENKQLDILRYSKKKKRKENRISSLIKNTLITIDL